jgi:NADPH:quinone reductase-like Zn-dependent oxidoreductase
MLAQSRDLGIVSNVYQSRSKPGPFRLRWGGRISRWGGVTRWKVGDRVAPIFVQRWLGGNLLLEYMSSALGGPSDGVLAEKIVLNQEGLVQIPSHLLRGSAMPCAAVTAWNAAL